MEEPDSAAAVAATLEVVEQILDQMGIGEHPGDAVLVGRGEGDGVLGAQFGGFIGRFCIRMGCMPYPITTVGHLTVRQFCERYARESYPDPPHTPLDDHRYPVEEGEPDERTVYETQPFPICFVLGCGRSGTTLFQAMLNGHDTLWAPGELHLAQFDTMADRAAGAGPFLRHALVPEAATRFGESPAVFSDRLASWERDGVPIPEVYRLLHEADPQRLIVDKTPSYSGRARDLEWIAAHFDDARFVHLIRNPYDVIRSLVRMQLYKDALTTFEPGTNPYHVAETLWVRHNENIAGLLDGIGDERSLVVRFEDLVTDPETILGGVCDVLGVPYQSAMANPYARDTVAQGAGDPRVNLLSEVEQRQPSEPFYPLGRRAAALARRYGYGSSRNSVG